MKLLDSDEAKVTKALMRVRILGKRYVAATGTSEGGSDYFTLMAASVGLVCRETPPTKDTAFIVQFQFNPRLSNIGKALDLGIPVLSESEALKVIETLGKQG